MRSKLLGWTALIVLLILTSLAGCGLFPVDDPVGVALERQIVWAEGEMLSASDTEIRDYWAERVDALIALLDKHEREQYAKGLGRMTKIE